VTTRRPRAPRAISLAAGLAGTAALLHPVTRAYLPWPMFALLAGVTAALTWIAWHQASRRWRIECCGRRWRIEVLDRLPGCTGARALRDATLSPGGHRAGSHLLMHFRDSAGRRLSCCVWRRAVPAPIYGRLQLAMLGRRASASGASPNAPRAAGAQRCVTLERSRIAESRS